MHLRERGGPMPGELRAGLRVQREDCEDTMLGGGKKTLTGLPSLAKLEPKIMAAQL